MAHAWVEVAFPGYGWLEFDPTTEKLAEDEEFRFAPGTDPALFERLMREILENRSRLQKKEGADEAQITSNLNSIARFAITSLKNNWLPLLAAALVLIFVYIRFGLFISVFLTGNYRKKSIRLMKHTWRRLKLSGRAKESGLLSEPELALKLDSQYPGIYSMYRGSAAARFAPEYTKEDFQTQWENYKKLKINKRKSLLRTKGSIVLCSLLFALSQTSAQVPPDDTAYQTPDALYNAASEADFSENWERAIQLYKEGSSRFPGDDRFSWALGNLYYSRYLYGMAWDEYRKTEAISPENPGILIRLARTAGYLNRNTVAVEYYKKVLDIDPDNKEAIGSLGWMYFKVHRLADGEKLLVSALDRFGDDPDFSMTLGTVYSDMYRYDDSKRWYTKAIELGEIIEDRVFTSIAWYNLSILESRFYNYELCMEATNSSLNIQNRASGRLARGELLKRRLELESSQKEHQTAYEIDTSPLAKINLAQIYQISGRLVEAQAYAEDCLKGGDNSWMVNFGIDPDRYKRDIHHILANTYNGLLKTEKLTPRSKTGEKIQALFKKASYKLKYEVNIRLFRKYCLAAANAYVEYGSEGWADGGSHLDAYIQYYNAFNDYPRRALAYLNMARRFETALMPAAVPSYDMDEGYTLIKLDKRSAGRLLDDAIDSLDPVWEREQIARCIRAFANPKNRRLTSSNYTKQEAAEELFAMNRGILRQMGIKLPVYINTFSEDASAGKILEKAVLLGAFKKTDWYARYRLYIRINGSQASSPPEPSYSASFELVDSKGEIDNILFSTQIRDPGKNEYYDISRNFGNLVFTVE
jgi:tetratricopeptide (TPR) repeat protein